MPTPDVVGPSRTRNEGIIGEGIDLTRDLRKSTILYHLTTRLLMTKWSDAGDDPRYSLFGQLKRITREWLDKYLVCKGDTYPAQILYLTLADMACEKITAAITRSHAEERPIQAILDPYNPASSTRHVSFNTSKTTRWTTDPRTCHVNYVICDSDWEAQFCRVAEGTRASARVRQEPRPRTRSAVPFLR